MRIPVSFTRRWRLTLLAAFLLGCALFGGSSRPNNLSLLAVRPLAAGYLVVALALPRPRHWAGLGWPLILLAAFAATMVLQLVPLPPAVWTTLPGHARFIEAASALGVPQPWRPITVSPDMTFNSLLALLIPLAVLVGCATLAPEQRIDLLPVLLVAIVFSAMLGIAQWAGTSSSPLYPYQYSNRDLPIGLFANRNHQATFLAMSFPLLRAWAVLPSRMVPSSGVRSWLAGAIALLIFPILLASGSRSGLVLAVIGAAAAWAIAPPQWRNLFGRKSSRRRALIAVAVVGGFVAVIGATMFFGRALSFARIGQLGQVDADLRVRYFPIIVHIVRDFLPFGTGFGTFDAVFRIYEPFWALNPAYFNRAHDDLLELVMTGGIPALLALVAFLAFAIVRVRAMVIWGWQRSGTVPARCGTALLVIVLAASLSDYPLRTPAMGMVFALATAWLAFPFAPLRAAAPGARGGRLR